MKPLGINFHGGLRDDCSGMHSFLFFKRKGWRNCAVTSVMLMFVLNRFHYRSPISHAPDPWDCPPHVQIESYGPGAHTASMSPNDVIVAVKRYMSDSDLAQARSCRSTVWKNSLSRLGFAPINKGYVLIAFPMRPRCWHCQLLSSFVWAPNFLKKYILVRCCLWKRGRDG